MAFLSFQGKRRTGSGSMSVLGPRDFNLSFLILLITFVLSYSHVSSNKIGKYNKHKHTEKHALLFASYIRYFSHDSFFPKCLSHV